MGVTSNAGCSDLWSLMSYNKLKNFWDTNSWVSLAVGNITTALDKHFKTPSKLTARTSQKEAFQWLGLHCISYNLCFQYAQSDTARYRQCIFTGEVVFHTKANLGRRVLCMHPPCCSLGSLFQGPISLWGMNPLLTHNLNKHQALRKAPNLSLQDTLPNLIFMANTLSHQLDMSLLHQVDADPECSSPSQNY